MVRPRKCRSIRFSPKITYFKPQGVSLQSLEVENLLLDEIEALRLSEIESLSQAEAAEKMQVHQSTFHRILASARRKIALALINGRAIKINASNEGDTMPNKDGTGPEGKGPMTGRRQGRCKDASETEVPPRRGLGRGQGLGRGLGQLGDGQGLGRRAGGRGRGQGTGRGLGRRQE